MALSLKDKYGVFEIGLNESQPWRLLSPEYPTPQEAFRRLEGIFDEHDPLPHVYAVKNISTGDVVGSVRRNAVARRVQAKQREHRPG